MFCWKVSHCHFSVFLPKHLSTAHTFSFKHMFNLSLSASHITSILEVIWGESRWEIHLSLPVRWTHLFWARVNNSSWVWAKESLRFLFVGLVFSLLLEPSSSVTFFFADYFIWILHYSLSSFVYNFLTLCLSVSSHSFASSLSCASSVFRLFYCIQTLLRFVTVLPQSWEGETVKEGESCPSRLLILPVKQMDFLASSAHDSMLG